MSDRTNFYCQCVSGDANFSIDEWNEQFAICRAAGIDMPPGPEPCKQQCDSCINIVLDTKAKNKSKYNW